jgi:hypothetical protein
MKQGDEHCQKKRNWENIQILSTNHFQFVEVFLNSFDQCPNFKISHVSQNNECKTLTVMISGVMNQTETVWIRKDRICSIGLRKGFLRITIYIRDQCTQSRKTISGATFSWYRQINTPDFTSIITQHINIASTAQPFVARQYLFRCMTLM